MNRLQRLAYAGIALGPATQPIPAPPVTIGTVQDILTTVAQFLIVISLVIAVIMIVYGGIRWMIASDPAEAKKIVLNGIIGAAIVLAVGIILQTVGYVVSFRG